MHGLIFVTWEKYLSERFGGSFLYKYRAVIGETPAQSPLASRVYNDETLLAGVGAACKLTGLTADVLLCLFKESALVSRALWPSHDISVQKGVIPQ